MRRILNIGGNDVAFECNAVTSILYKQEFSKNYFAEIMKLNKVAGVLQDLTKATDDELDSVDFDVITRLAWACAKTADRNTKSFMDWIFDNPEFNINDHGTVIVELIQSNFETKKK